ncbi:hypothetical protein [Streptomyces sp. 8N706]|uniref:hypothetical protein n=1 Tax=Streptomyces sp. 8N706 TaxID=3457416 RepID=UPI003FCF4982
MTVRRLFWMRAGELVRPKAVAGEADEMKGWLALHRRLRPSLHRQRHLAGRLTTAGHDQRRGRHRWIRHRRPPRGGQGLGRLCRIRPWHAPGASTDGQTIELPQAATALSFLGSAVNGNQSAEAEVTYTDGSSDTVDCSFTDWTVGRGSGTVQCGNATVARTPYRNVSGGEKAVVDAHVVATAPFRAAAGKKIRSVTPPDNGNLHVFMVALG